MYKRISKKKLTVTNSGGQKGSEKKRSEKILGEIIIKNCPNIRQ